MVAATEAATPPAMALALWRGEAADRTATKVKAATEAAAATAATEVVAEAVAEAVAVKQQQRCHGGGGRGGNISGGVDRAAAATNAVGTTKGVGATEGARATEGEVATVVIGHGIVGKDIPIVARLVKARRWSKR